MLLKGRSRDNFNFGTASYALILFCPIINLKTNANCAPNNNVANNKWIGCTQAGNAKYAKVIPATISIAIMKLIAVIYLNATG